MKKYAEGQLLTEDQKKTASKWSEDDAAALAKENAKADGRDDEQDD